MKERTAEKTRKKKYKADQNEQKEKWKLLEPQKSIYIINATGMKGAVLMRYKTAQFHTSLIPHSTMLSRKSKSLDEKNTYKVTKMLK